MRMKLAYQSACGILNSLIARLLLRKRAERTGNPAPCAARELLAVEHHAPIGDRGGSERRSKKGKRDNAEKVATNVANVKQVVNDLQVKDQKASSSR
jgi:hypothetical protein